MRSQLSPDRLALTNGQESWSFAQLDRIVSQLAQKLSRLAIHEGDRVAVMAESTMEMAAIIHALARLGAVVAPINPRFLPADQEAMLHDAAPSLLIATSHDQTAFPHVIATDTLWHDLASEETYPPTMIDLSRVQCLMYTSGTTGRPKGALISYGNIYYSAIFSAIHNGTIPSDLWLHVMPLFHIGGLSILFRSVITGSGIVLFPRFDVDQVWDGMSRYPVSLLSLVPTMLHRLMHAKSSFPASVRLILLGGAPASPSLIDQALAAKLPVVQTYGLTETSSQIATQQIPVHGSPKNAGYPIYPTDVAILSKNQVTHDTHDIGEIVVKGPTIFQGYWKNPQKTREVFWNDWFRTGDIGFLDDTGYLHVIDRKKDLIIRGGENISPTEIENAFTTHPLILDAGVIAEENREWGQVPVIMLVSTAPLSRQECLKWAETHLSSIKRPVRYYSADSLPRTASGKLRRPALWQRWNNGAYREIL